MTPAITALRVTGAMDHPSAVEHSEGRGRFIDRDEEHPPIGRIAHRLRHAAAAALDGFFDERKEGLSPQEPFSQALLHRPRSLGLMSVMVSPGAGARRSERWTTPVMPLQAR